ncbi:YchJ family protein [Snodgrassella sp. CFCC 13594]|uniref:YchJ family protein n=1 Tax=Snodgrassella sp. CFCC 13594 TaxID=1775559 RepID=UPI000B2C8EFE|nr:YchJ family metal-binding protein [Snodgrassella sp. CFCC 13594]
MKKKAQPHQVVCPCGALNNKGHTRLLAECCGPYLRGARQPENAAVLMRSRYTAYACHDFDYIKRTWHPQTRPLDVGAQENSVKWIGLTVTSHRILDAQHEIVAFVARYKDNGRAEKLAETSRFECINGQWLYVDGDLND